MIFPHTDQLREIVESLEWTFIQIPPEGLPWEEIEARGPAKNLEIGHTCIMVPMAVDGESLRGAYSHLCGLGPSMVIDPSWKGLSEYETGTSSIERKGEILFSRIWIPNEKIFAIVTPRTPENPNPSMATFHNSDIVETFENYFRIVSPEDYGIGRPPN